MIFDPVTVREIVRGEKTQLRRLARGDGVRTTVRRHRTCVIRPFEPRPGQRIPLTGSGLAHRLVIVAARQELLGAITPSDALAEGHPTREQFAADWVSRHDRRSVDGDVRWWAQETDRLLACLPVDPADLPDLADQLDVSERAIRRRLAWLHTTGAVAAPADGWNRLEHAEWLATQARFQSRWAKRLVWVVEFELDRHQRPRLLAPATRPAGSEHGYVESPAVALPDEPEALDDVGQGWVTHRARLAASQQLALERGRREIWLQPLGGEERIAKAHQAAITKRRDVSTEVFLLRRLLTRGTRTDRVERRLQRLETRAYTSAS